MLNIQKYLRDGNKPEQLKAELGINVYEHPSLPLMGFKYDQIDSPKTHPIVREARGLVLEKGSWDIVAKGFNRFYNLGEDPDGFKNFDWTNFSIAEKVDGSLMIVYHYQGEWRLNTSGSFGFGECNSSGKSWRDLFWSTLGVKPEDVWLEPHLVHIFELCTLQNKVVRYYPKPTVFLLGLFNQKDGSELDVSLISDYVTHVNHRNKTNIQLPQVYNFKSTEEIMAFLKTKEDTDKTYEGVVIRDKTGIRAKVKSATYVAIHHMMDNGNIFNPARQVPLVLAGETDELFIAMKDIIEETPDLKARIEQTKAEVNAEWEKLLAVWEAHRTIADQKAFALAIKDKTPFTGILFGIRKQHGQGQTVDHLKKVWRESADLITKRLYG